MMHSEVLSSDLSIPSNLLELSSAEYSHYKSTIDKHKTIMSFPHTIQGSLLALYPPLFEKMQNCVNFKFCIYSDEELTKALNTQGNKSDKRINATLKKLSKSEFFKNLINKEDLPANCVYIFPLETLPNTWTSLAVFTPKNNSLFYFNPTGSYPSNAKNLRSLLYYTLHKVNVRFHFHQVFARNLVESPENFANSVIRAFFLDLLLKELKYTTEHGYILGSGNMIMKNFNYSFEDFEVDTYEKSLSSFFDAYKPLVQCPLTSSDPTYSDLFSFIPPFRAKSQEELTLETPKIMNPEPEVPAMVATTSKVNQDTQEVSEPSMNDKAEDVQLSSNTTSELEQLIEDLKSKNTLNKSLNQCNPVKKLAWAKLTEACKKDSSIIHAWIKNVIVSSKPFVRNPNYQRRFNKFCKDLGIKVPKLLKAGTFLLINQLKELINAPLAPIGSNLQNKMESLIIEETKVERNIKILTSPAPISLQEFRDLVRVGEEVDDELRRRMTPPWVRSAAPAEGPHLMQEAIVQQQASNQQLKQVPVQPMQQATDVPAQQQVVTVQPAQQATDALVQQQVATASVQATDVLPQPSPTKPAKQQATEEQSTSQERASEVPPATLQATEEQSTVEIPTTQTVGNMILTLDHSQTSKFATTLMDPLCFGKDIDELLDEAEAMEDNLPQPEGADASSALMQLQNDVLELVTNPNTWGNPTTAYCSRSGDVPTPMDVDS